jgi:hypothetical protein
LPEGATESVLKKYGDDYCRVVKTNYEKSVNGYTNISLVRDGLTCDSSYAVAIKPMQSSCEQGHFCILIPTRSVKSVSEKKKSRNGKKSPADSTKSKPRVDLNNPFLAKLLKGGFKRMDVNKEFKNCLSRMIETMSNSKSETMPKVDNATLH